jgi:hypothetical protein
MRHHGFSCSSLYTVTPEQAQENLLIETLLPESASPVGLAQETVRLLQSIVLVVAVLPDRNSALYLQEAAAFLTQP